MLSLSCEPTPLEVFEAPRSSLGARIAKGNNFVGSSGVWGRGGIRAGRAPHEKRPAGSDIEGLGEMKDTEAVQVEGERYAGADDKGGPAHTIDLRAGVEH